MSVARAVVLLSGAAHAPLRTRLATSVAAGMTLALAWELWEYVAFVTRSGEAGTAYADTVGDLALGWLGAVAAGLLVGSAGCHPEPVVLGTDAAAPRDLRP